MKTCIKCGTDYPATTEYFYAHKQHKDGLQSSCKECYRLHCKEYHQTEHGKERRQTEEHKSYQENYRKTYYQTINGHLRHIFSSMKQRCTDPEHNRYYRYGGRGIELRFTSDEFVDYVTNKLQVDPRGLEIDRIDNNGHYERGNIRFVTAKENCANRG